MPSPTGRWRSRPARVGLPEREGQSLKSPVTKTCPFPAYRTSNRSPSSTLCHGPVERTVSRPDSVEVTLDFNVEESFVRAGQSGMYIFKPVVQAESVVDLDDESDTGSGDGTGSG